MLYASAILWLVAAAAVGAAFFYTGGLKVNQKARNAFLEREIAVIETKHKEIQTLREEHAKLTVRIKVIQQLQKNRTVLIHVLDDLAKLAPDGLYFDRLEKREETVTLAGGARSNNEVSSLMRALEDSDWFHDPRLTVINVVGDGNERLSRFTLRVERAGRADRAEDHPG